MSSLHSQRGFTLIEIIVVMVVLGLMALMGSFGLERAIDGYNLARENSQISQKAQNALDRLAVELSHIPYSSLLSRYTISAGTAGSLTYTANFGGANEIHTFTQSGNQLLLDNLPLTDLVVSGNGLQFSYLDKDGNAVGGGAIDPGLRIIQISLSLRGPNANVTRTFNTRVALQG
jgi:prepilin-type N-terminal cleavage/methylation domain-containing protein